MHPSLERRRTTIPWGADAALGRLFAVVPDAIQGTREIIGDQKRAIAELRHIDRPAQIFAVIGEPAFGKRLGLVGSAIVLEGSYHHPRAHRNSTVPRAVLSGED